MQNAMCRIEGLEETLRDLMDAAEGVIDFAGVPLVRDADQFYYHVERARACVTRAMEILTKPTNEAGEKT